MLRKNFPFKLQCKRPSTAWPSCFSIVRVLNDLVKRFSFRYHHIWRLMISEAWCWSWRVCCAFSRSPMTWHGVNQRGRTPTRSYPTTTTLTRTLTTITPGATGYSRTSLARANHRFQSWWHQKIKVVCVQISNRPLASPSLLCCHQWKATAKVKHQTRAANRALVRTVCRHKIGHRFCFSLSGWDPSQLWNQALCVFRTNFWYMITTRGHKEDCMSPWSSLYSNDLFIYSASISDFFLSVSLHLPLLQL